MKIFAVFALSLFLRLFYLGTIPVSLSHDETDNIIQAHSVIQTGHDIEGTWQPWSLLPNNGVMAELAPLINVPALSLFGQSLFTDRLTTAFLSSLFPLLIWWWLSLIKVDQKVAEFSSWLLAISPWHLIISRSAFEAPTSLFFMALSWIFLAYLFQTKKRRAHYLTFTMAFVLSYSFSYFTYHGSKFSLPILTTLYLAWLSYTSKKLRLFKFLLVFTFLAALVVRTSIYASYYGSRSSEIALLNQSKFAEQVDIARRQSLAPELVKQIFINKPTLMLTSLKDKYVGTIAPDLLFLHGEANGVFSVWQTGYFYLFALPIMLLGLFVLSRFSHPSNVLILSLLIVSPLSSVIHVNNSIVLRSGMYLVLLNVVLAYGLVYFLDYVSAHYPKLKFVTNFSVIGLFVVGLANFCYLLYFVTPITNADDYFFADRILGNYLRLNQNKKTLVVTPQPRYILASYLLSNQNITQSAIGKFNHLYPPSDSASYDLPSVTVVQSCSKINTTAFDTIIVHKDLLDTSLRECPNLADQTLSIVTPKNSGEVFRIYHDSLCQKIAPNHYVRPTRLADFKLESMDSNTLCINWIVAQ